MTEWLITSSVLILAVLVLRTLLRGRLNPRLQYGLWALVLVRLLLPVSLPASEMSVMSSAPAQVIVQLEWQADRVTLPEETEKPPQIQRPTTLPQTGPVVSQPVRTEDIPQKPRTSLTATQVLTAVWITGMVCVGLTLLVSNLWYLRRLRGTRVPMDIPEIPLDVYRSTQAAGPCLFGLIRPGIYLPPEDAQKTEIYPIVLTHELTHYRHGDHIWSVLRCVCLVIHWYNPLVWLAAAVSKQDAELACDAAAIARLGENRRREYGDALIDMTAIRQNPKDFLLISTAMSGGKKALKERISMIAKSPKMKLYTRVTVVLTMCFAVVCTFTGGKMPEKPEEPVIPEQTTVPPETTQALSATPPETTQAPPVAQLETVEELSAALSETLNAVLDEIYHRQWRMDIYVLKEDYILRQGNEILFRDLSYLSGVPLYLNGSMLAYDVQTGKIRIFCEGGEECDHTGGVCNKVGVSYLPQQWELPQDTEFIRDGEVGVYKLIVNDRYALYLAYGNLYVLDSEEKNLKIYEAGSIEPRTVLEDFCAYWNEVYGGYLYGHDGLNLMRVDLRAEDLKAEQLTQRVVPITDGEHIYYTESENNLLYRCNMDGTDPELLVQMQVQLWSGDEDAVYFYTKMVEGYTDIWRLSKENPTYMTRIAQLPYASYEIISLPGQDVVFAVPLTRVYPDGSKETYDGMYIVKKDGSGWECWDYWTYWEGTT